MLAIDRRGFIASLGGAAAVGLMSHEARADALEEALLAQLNSGPQGAAARATAAAANPGAQMRPRLAFRLRPRSRRRFPRGTIGAARARCSTTPIPKAT